VRLRAALTAVVVSVVAVAAAAGPAAAFVRKTSGIGVPERWPQSCVPITVYLNGYTALTRDEVAKSVAAAARAWGPDAVTCDDGLPPYLELVTMMADEGAAAPAVAYDTHNSVVFETDGWSGSDPLEVAVTYTFTQPGGRIVDADLRVNAAYHSFANLDPGGGGDFLSFDLQNAITHELGHLIGLDHTCLLVPEDPRPVDEQGNEVPDCADAAAPMLAATMFPSTDPGRTSQRWLSPDDVRGVCAIYPAAADPHICPLDIPDDGCGCAASGEPSAPTGAGGFGFLLAAAVIAGRRRLRGRAQPGSTSTRRFETDASPSVRLAGTSTSATA
jgi:MYXO-CTERM domain-containing protein